MGYCVRMCSAEDDNEMFECIKYQNITTRIFNT